MRDFSSIAARFEGAFSDYEIHLSTQMSGYFIITKRGGYSSELIGEEVGELVFKDCTKTSDEIRAYISEKTPKENEQENAQKSSKESSLGFEIKETKEAFEIDKKPSALAFSIEFEEKSTEPAFEIIDKEDESPAFEIAYQDTSASKSPAFEIIDENSSEGEGDEGLVGESPAASFEIIDDDDTKNSGKSLVDESLTDESPAFSFEIEDEISNKGAGNKNLAQANQSLANDEIIIPTHHDSQKIFFAKNTEIISAKVVEVELVISGYDESCDSFSFEKIPPDCEYKYSIKIGELRAIFIATMDADTASEFISGFSFKTERQVPKNIEIFINESAEPVLETTLFA